MNDQPPRDDRGTDPSDGPPDGTADSSSDRLGDSPSDRTPAGSSGDRSGTGRRNTTILSGIASVLGLWIAISVFVYDVGAATLWNNLVVGAAVFLIAGYNYYRGSTDVPIAVAAAALVAVLGLWLVVSPVLFEMATGVFWSTLITGAVIAALAAYNAYEGREARTIGTETDAGTP